MNPPEPGVTSTKAACCAPTATEPACCAPTATEPACCEPAASPAAEAPVDEAIANEDLARLTKALGHPARVAIMRLLQRRQACVCGEIVDELPLAQSTVSQHLKQLKDAGLIRGDVDGPRVCYCVEPGAVAQLKALVAAL